MDSGTKGPLPVGPSSDPVRPLALGLTGGMGSGKTTVLGWFAEAGWATLEADAEVRRMLGSDTGLIQEIASHFGPDVLLPGGGGIHRASLAELVFRDGEALDWLEAVIHPRVRERWKEFLEIHQNRPRIVEIPLLFEKNLEKAFDMSVLVFADAATQLDRLRKRGIDPTKAQLRLQRQLPSELKARRADFVLTNDGSLSFLRQQFERLIKQLDRSTTACREAPSHSRADESPLSKTFHE